MKNFLKLKVFLACFFVIVGLDVKAVQAELIEPSRTLRASPGDTGHLTVFSEPPGLNVKLDGASFGKTPIRIRALDPGIHHLQVQESFTEIIIEPGKTFHISLFKNKFIPFQISEKEPAAPSGTTASSAAGGRAFKPPPQQLSNKEEDRKAWERWMQFVNGSTKHF